jgi:hypothetical protein
MHKLMIQKVFYFSFFAKMIFSDTGNKKQGEPNWTPLYITNKIQLILPDVRLRML